MLTSKRIEEIKEKLPKELVRYTEKHMDLLPYMDEGERFAFWLLIGNTYTQGKLDVVNADIKAYKGGSK